MSYGTVRLVWFLFAAGLSCSGQMVRAEQATNETDVTDQTFFSLRADIYKKRFRRLEDDGWGAYLTVRASAGLFEFETVDEVLAFDRERIATIELRPSIEFELPVGFLDHVYVVPGQKIGFVRETWQSTQYVTSITEVKLRYFEAGEFEDLSVTLGMEYGTRYSEELINTSDHVAATLEATTRHSLGVRIGTYRFMVSPYGKISHYIDGLDLEAPDGARFQVTERYEIGAKFGTDPRYRIWKFKMPQLRITYDFSGEFSGIRVKLGG